MCSTPRGSGSSPHARPVQIDEGNDDDYLKMLQRASSKFEQNERHLQQKEAEDGGTTEDHSE
jgi:hypothetical protein